MEAVEVDPASYGAVADGGGSIPELAPETSETVQKLRQENEGLRAEHGALSDVLDRLVTKAEGLEQANETCNARIQELEQANAQLRKDKSALAESVAQLEAHFKELVQSHAEVCAELEAAREFSDDMEQARSLLRQNLQDVEDLVTSGSFSIDPDRSMSETGDADSRVSNATLLQRHAQQLQALKAHTDAVERRNEELTAELAETKASLADTRRQVARLVATLQESAVQVQARNMHLRDLMVAQTHTAMRLQESERNMAESSQLLEVITQLTQEPSDTSRVSTATDLQSDPQEELVTQLQAQNTRLEELRRASNKKAHDLAQEKQKFLERIQLQDSVIAALTSSEPSSHRLEDAGGTLNDEEQVMHESSDHGTKQTIERDRRLPLSDDPPKSSSHIGYEDTPGRDENVSTTRHSHAYRSPSSSVLLPRASSSYVSSRQSIGRSSAAPLDSVDHMRGLSYRVVDAGKRTGFFRFTSPDPGKHRASDVQVRRHESADAADNQWWVKASKKRNPRTFGHIPSSAGGRR